MSIANLTRADGEEFLKLAPRVPVRATTEPYPLDKANEALDDLRAGHLEGAAVLVPYGTRLSPERRPLEHSTVHFITLTQVTWCALT